MADGVDEETQRLEELAKKGEHPETVSWGQYVGIKESLGKKLDTATQKVGTLEEQLKGAISTDEHSRIKMELESAKTAFETSKTEHQKVSDELKGVKDKSTSEKRGILTKRGVPEDKVTAMSEEQLDAAVGVLEYAKPGADMGAGGGGAGDLGGMSPKDRVREADKRQREINK